MLMTLGNYMLEHLKLKEEFMHQSNLFLLCYDIANL